MAELRKQLIDQLEKLPGVTVRLWKPDYHLMVVYYKDKEVAHFHGNNEIDIRLSPKVVKQEGLRNDPKRIGHPSRKDGGTWLVQRFTRKAHLDEMRRLVKLAISLR